MTTIFALQGTSNSGKTETLIQLYNDLISKYPKAIIQELHRGTRDITVILSGVSGKIIGIESQGDPGSRLKKSLDKFLAAKCDVIFCACRTRGMTVDWINALSGKHQIQFVRKVRVDQGYTAANAAAAANLIRLAKL